MYVEDDADVRASLERILADRGYEVVAVSTAEEAVGALEEDHYDLVLTDYHLPYHNADWLLWVARQHGHLDGTAAIVLSGDTDPRGTEDYPYLRKPVDLQDLFAVLARETQKLPTR